MDPLLGLGMGALEIGGSLLAGKSQDKAQRQALQAQRLATQEAIKRLQEVGLPSEEAQRIVLEEPQLVEEYTGIKLGDSALAGIQLDPTYKQAQMDALRQLQTMGQEGLGLEDQIALDRMMRDVESSEQARQKGIMQQMAQRGSLDSGASLIQQLQSSADSTQRAQERSEALALQAQQARRDAISRAANTAQGIEKADYERQFNLGNARDIIERANVRNMQDIGNKNVDLRQNYSDLARQTRDKQQYIDADLERTLYQQKLDRANDLNSITTGQANVESKYQENKGNRRAEQYAGGAAGLGQMFKEGFKLF